MENEQQEDQSYENHAAEFESHLASAVRALRKLSKFKFVDEIRLEVFYQGDGNPGNMRCFGSCKEKRGRD